jgi:phosphoribosylglycinamide formyltransferase-1
MTKRFAIFASGNGSNAEALMNYAKQSDECQVVLVLTDQKEAGVIEKAKTFSVTTEVCSFEKGISFQDAKQLQEEKVITLLDEYKVDYILLAGYMRILSSQFVDRYFGKLINIHPSMLPKFPGPDGYGDAFRAGVEESGITIHFVDSGVDTGPIIIQQKFPRLEKDSLDSFKKRGLEIEHQFYPKVMQWLAEGRVHLSSKQEVELRIEV